ncbi:hypothetical protein DV736_g3282, partial [Chaetothyriales sp. CBS 134916]
MGIWDAFGGHRTSSQAPPPPTSNTSSSSTALHPDFSSPLPAGAIDTSSFLGSLPDAAALHPLAGLNQQTLDYLSLDESALSDLPGSRSILPSRGWSDDLCYGTGITYITALTIGGTWGFIEGLNRVPASAPPKLRINGVLNSMTRRGPFLANNAGVVAMVYNGINSTIGYYRGKHDVANSVVSGALAGMVFRSTRGPKQMAISAGIVASVACAWAMTRKVLFEVDEARLEMAESAEIKL